MNIESGKNYISFCYQILALNNDKIDINKYDENMRIQIEKLYDFKQKCCKKFINFIKQIYDKHIYISKKEVIDIYNKNNEELYNLLISNPDYMPIIMMPDVNLSKSNIFFTLYFLKFFYEKYGIKFPYAFSRISDIFENMIEKKSGVEVYGTFKNITLKEEFREEFRDKTLIFIIIDDFSYSGNQLAGHLVCGKFGPLDKKKLDMSSIYDGKMQFDTKIKYYLNIIGMTDTAEKLIKNEFEYPDLHLIIPKAIIKVTAKFSDILKSFTDQYIIENDLYILRFHGPKNNGKIGISSEFYNIFKTNEELSLVIPFHKYPDIVSTVQFLCAFRTYDNSYIVDHNQFCILYPLFKEKLRELVFNKGFINIDDIVNFEMYIKLDNILKTGKVDKDIKWLTKCDNKNDSEMIKLIESCNIDKTHKIFNCNKICPSFYSTIDYVTDLKEIKTKVLQTKLIVAKDVSTNIVYDEPITFKVIFRNYELENKIIQNEYSYGEYIEKSKHRMVGGFLEYHDNKQKYTNLKYIITSLN